MATASLQHLAPSTTADPLSATCPDCGQPVSEAVRAALDWLYGGTRCHTSALADHLARALQIVGRSANADVFRWAFEDWSGAPLEDVAGAARHAAGCGARA